MQIKYLDLGAVNKPVIDTIAQAADSVIRSGWYLRGKATAGFESAFAGYCGASHCVGVGNGLDALKIILLACRHLSTHVATHPDWPDALRNDWNRTDSPAEVIVPAHTFIASIEAIRLSGLRPVLCDVTEDALLDTTQAENLVNERTVAIMPVHLYGRVCDMEAVRTLADRHNLMVVEDAAQAHGATGSHNRRAGNLGHAAAFSFYPTKNLGALGDGGAIVTSFDALADTCRTIANYGMHRKYVHEVSGVNSRLDEVQAAILNTKLPHLDNWNERRRSLASLYLQGISHPDIRLPQEPGPRTGQMVWHVFPVYSHRRDELQRHLLDAGVETLIHYPIPPHKQQAFAHLNGCSYPVTERLCAEELSLPLHQEMTEREITYIIDTINRF